MGLCLESFFSWFVSASFVVVVVVFCLWFMIYFFFFACGLSISSCGLFRVMCFGVLDSFFFLFFVVLIASFFD